MGRKYYDTRWADTFGKNGDMPGREKLKQKFEVVQWKIENGKKLTEEEGRFLKWYKAKDTPSNSKKVRRRGFKLNEVSLKGAMRSLFGLHPPMKEEAPVEEPTEVELHE